MLTLETVLDAARRRLRFIFDRFDRVVASISGGKDSLVLWHLAREEARRRGARVEAFFLDQEAEYAGTIEVIEHIMADPQTIPQWFQVPLRMTNATSHVQTWLHAWAPGEAWMRPRSPCAISEASGAPDRFYDFFPWYEQQTSVPTAFLVGLRSRESLNRWRAAVKSPGYQGIGWSTKAAHAMSFRFYPLFDWAFGDVWKYIADEALPYNRVYDRMYQLRGSNERTMRVSFLVHEQSFRALTQLHELEPETYERLLRRLNGTHFAAQYAEEPLMAARVRPAHFDSWHAYRAHLLATTPLAQLPRMQRRFSRQGEDEATCREHCRQLLINDWENNVPIRRTRAEKLRALWWERL